MRLDEMNMLLKGIALLFKREIKIISNDSDLITIVLLSPLFYALFLGTIYLNKSESDVPMIVVDMDRTQTSESFIRNLDAHQLIKINDTAPDLNFARERIYSLDEMGIIYIPKNFGSSLKKGKGTDLKLFYNTSRFLISNDMNKAVSEVAGTFSAGIRLKYFETQGYNFEQSKELIEPIKHEIKSLFNPNESYGDFFLPGFLGLVLQQTLLIGFAESIARERKEKSFHHLYKISGNRISAVIIGKSLFYLLLFSSYALLFFSAGFNLFKLSITGSGTALSILTILFISSVIIICFIIASFFKEKITALQIFAFTSIPIFLISGFPWPFKAMPSYLVVAAQLIPSTPYLNAMQRITMMGAGFSEVVPEITHLVIMSILSISLLYIRFRAIIKEENKY